jgi:transcriptional regulator with XRE-family HTH domain
MRWRPSVSRPNSRDLEKDPAAALGQTLKRLREAAGISTWAAAGARIGYGEDLIRKAESGAQVPSEVPFLKMLKLYQVPDLMRPTVIDMWKLARKSKGPIPEYFELYIEREKMATFLRLWGLLLIPGPLQTYEYAHAIFTAAGLDEDTAAEKATARVERGAIVHGSNAANVTALIYEPVLSLRVGAPEVMTGQIAHLLLMSQRRNVILQVVPVDGYFPGLDGQFDIVSGPEIPDTVDMVTVEDQVSDDPATVRTVAALFEEIRSYARDAKESRSLLMEADERWNSQ